MENQQKQRKLKKHEVANEKKRKYLLKVADSHSEPGNLQKRGNFHFLFFLNHFCIIFLIFFARGT
jgi:hypothetical protein